MNSLLIFGQLAEGGRHVDLSQHDARPCGVPRRPGLMSVRVDSHCHLWRRARGDYGWLDPSNAALAPLMRDFEPHELTTQLSDHAIDMAVLIQAAPTSDETRFLLDLAQATPAVGGVVGWIDLTDLATIDTLTEFAADPAFKGVRPMLQDLSQDDWITTAPQPDVVHSLTLSGLRFDALVTERHLPHLLEFALAHPDLPLVIDHAAKPQWVDGRPSAGWRDGMARLAQETGAFCKLSGLLTELPSAAQDTGADLIGDVVQDILRWFGPDRLMWGSDWPVLTLAASYSDWVTMTDRLLDTLPASDRAAILGGTAQRFYGLEAIDV